MIEKVCEVCGAEFSVKPSRATTAKYCSRKCSDEAKKDRVKRICKVCGKEFESLPSRIKAGRGDCCSIDCRTIFRTNRIQVTAPLFIPVDMACHARTNNKRDYWEETLTNYIMIWFDGGSYNPVTNEIDVVNEQEITA